MHKSQRVFYLFFLCLQVACAQSRDAAVTFDQSNSQYEYRTSQSSDGTGKFYLGREIAQVMGHTGAQWLERPEREREERTDVLLRALSLQKDDVVADIGAGSGYFTFRMAPLVPKGKVLAVDIQPEMLELLNKKKQKINISNVETVLGDITDPKLPAGTVDLALLVDAYHEFSHPYEMMQNLVHSLKPGGRIALVEYRAEDPEVPIRPRHKMTETQARKEMEAAGLQFVENKKVLPQQHLLIFRKP